MPHLLRSDFMALRQNRIVGEHRHAWHELIYVANGRYRATTEQGPISLGVGESVIYPAGFRHLPGPHRSDVRIHCLLWSDDDGIGRRPRRGEDRDGRLRITLTLLWDLYHVGPPPQAVLDGLLATALHLHEQPIASGEADPVARARRMMVHDLRQDLRLDDVAAAAGISRTHLHRRFCLEVGTSPMRLRRELRLARALELIASTDQRLAEIAQQVGIANPNHLSTLVRRRTGSSPRQLRARARDGR